MPEDTTGAVPVQQEPATPAPAAEPRPNVTEARHQPLLRFNHVDTFYGQIQVLHDVNYVVYPGEIVALLGSNGAGKTTTMKTIMGIVRPRQGSVDFGLRRVDTISTPSIVKAGIAPVPEGRRVFARLTVEDNLRMGAYVRTDKAIGEDIA
ncbi:MAG TPA: ATP-binding cassette domain-containing protein, partial [Chloroflexota bacterium]